MGRRNTSIEPCRSGFELEGVTRPSEAQASLYLHVNAHVAGQDNQNREPLLAQAMRVVAESKLAVCPGKEPQRLWEPPANPMFQNGFCHAMAFRQSVAFTG